MKKWTIVLAVVAVIALAFGIFSFVQKGDVQKKLDEATGKVTELTNQAADLKTQAETALADLAAKTTELDGVKAELEGVKAELETAKVDLAAAAAPVVEAVEETTEAVTEAVEEATEAATEAVEETTEAVTEAVEEATEAATEAVEEVTEAVTETAETAAETVTESAEETAEAVAEVAEEAAAVVEETAGAKKVIVTHIADDPEQMDPSRNSYARSSRVLQNLFKGLYKLDADGATFVPAMAESVDIAEDGMTYTFHLRDGLKWSDGSDLTAYDFEFSWLHALAPESRCASDLWIIKNGQAFNRSECAAEEVGVKALDAKTFEVKLETLTPWLLNLTATTSFMPIKKDLVEAKEAAGEIWTADVANYVSNGPFYLAEYRSLNRLVLKKNPYYYDAANVKIDEVDFVIINDDSAALTAYENGELNIDASLNSEGVAKYAGSEEFHTSAKVGIQYCDFNCRTEVVEGYEKYMQDANGNLPFTDKRVRQAFAMAIDRQMLLETLGIVEPAVYGFVPYGQPSLTQPGKSYRDVAGNMFEENVEKAQALLAEAGYPKGEGMPTVLLVCKNDEQQKLMMQVLGEMWKANLGVNYEIQTLESSSYWGDLDKGHFTTDRNGYTVDFTDPSANLKIWITGSNASENAWDDADYDALFNASLTMTDPAEREAALIAAERDLVDKMPGFPVYSYENQYLVKPNVSGVICNAIGHIFYEYADIAD